MQVLKENYIGNDKWAKLGLKLGLLQPTLDVIKAKHNSDPDECMVDMLSHWLNRADHVDAKGGPKWTTLAITLKNMGYAAAHNNIVSDTIKMCHKITFILF